MDQVLQRFPSLTSSCVPNLCLARTELASTRPHHGEAPEGKHARGGISRVKRCKLGSAYLIGTIPCSNGSAKLAVRGNGSLQ